ncbi:MAG: low molecular weight phosphotyrosine protein phosphatase, partial [Burkholderiales bacterium]
RDNLSSLRRYTVGTHAHVGLFLEYAKQAGLVNTDEVPDPYYGGARGFEDVLDLIERASAGLLAAIVAEARANR